MQRENNIAASDNEILSEAIRLVSEGIAVTFPVNGRSMLPFIVGGQESVILERPRPAQVGDVVLAYVENCRYVIHRIVKIDGEHITLMGDGNLENTFINIISENGYYWYIALSAR